MDLLNKSVLAIAGIAIVYMAAQGAKINEAKRVDLEDKMDLSPTAARIMRTCESTLMQKKLKSTYKTGNELTICACSGKNIAKDIEPSQVTVIDEMVPVFFWMVKADLKNPTTITRFNTRLENIMVKNNLSKSEVKRLYKLTIDNLNMCAMPAKAETVKTSSRDPRNKLRSPKEQAEQDAKLLEYRKKLELRRKQAQQQ